MNHNKQNIRDRLALCEIDQAMIEMSQPDPIHPNTFCGGAYFCGYVEPDCLREGHHKCFFDPDDQVVVGSVPYGVVIGGVYNGSN